GWPFRRPGGDLDGRPGGGARAPAGRRRRGSVPSSRRTHDPRGDGSPQRPPLCAGRGRSRWTPPVCRDDHGGARAPAAPATRPTKVLHRPAARPRARIDVAFLGEPQAALVRGRRDHRAGHTATSEEAAYVRTRRYDETTERSISRSPSPSGHTIDTFAAKQLL